MSTRINRGVAWIEDAGVVRGEPGDSTRPIIVKDKPRYRAEGQPKWLMRKHAGIC